jgi:hypothetical protein
MNEVVKISDIFKVCYGVNLELVHLEQCDYFNDDAIYFVSRTENNNGVSAIVKKEIGIKPNPQHTISVAGGGSVLSSFYQPLPYYSGRDLYYLLPKEKLTITEMLFYAHCLTMNKYKYNYGRQANKTLKDILVPSKMPVELNNAPEKILAQLQKSIKTQFIIQ